MNKVSCQFYVVRQTLSALHSRAYHFRAIGLLVLCLLIPIIQISVYSLKDSGFLAELGLSQVANRAERVPVGVLINERDNMSYASWAEQPKLGRYLGSDLYTTDSHSTVYFNPYFVAAGLLSKLLGISVYACMIIFSILASGLFVFAAYCIGRQVGLGGPASASAAVATAFCSGPSWALYLLHAAIGYGATDSRPFLGVDGFYFDAFPVTIFIAYPYSAFNLATVAISIFLVNHAVFCGGELAWRRLAPAAAACACAILVRPYDGLLLSLLFPLCVVYRERCYPAVENGGYGRWKFSLIVSLFLLPFCAYVVCMSKLPVWRDFAKASLDSGPTRAEIFVGFAVLWVFAGCGMYRALRLRRVGMLFLSTWTITIIVMAIVMGGAMARFLGGSVLASSILAVYGIEGLRNICGGGGGQASPFRLGVIVLASTSLTSIFDYCSILIQRPPEIDAEIRSEALAIPIAQKGALPTVLTGCDAGLYLPGIAGLRVFAGHWSLTPDYKAKCHLLEEAGLTEHIEGRKPNTDLLLRLVRGVHADYVILPTGSAAEARLQESGLARVFASGRRWSTLRVVQ